MAEIKAIVFDVDGTLLNSSELIIAAYQHTAREHGLPEPSAEMVQAKLALALPIRRIVEELFPGRDADELLATKTTFIQSNYLMMQAYEGLHDLLEGLQDRGYKMAVLTGGNGNIAGVLEFHRIARYFSSVVHSDRTVRHKPDPEGFYLAVEECGAQAEQAVMVGDSRNDILTGKNAQALATIGITHGNDSRKNLWAAGADYIIDSLAELPQVLVTIEQS